MRLFTRLLCNIADHNSYFITTPIFYVNGDPHIGHLYTLLQADVLCKYQQFKGQKNVVFSTGTDEHGLKIQRAAASRNLKPEEFCDTISAEFKRLCSVFDIKYTHFVRTSSEKHKKSVQHFWKTLVNNGYIYKASFEGWYSVPDEMFVSSTDIVERTVNGKAAKISATSGHSLEWVKEVNYMFKLSVFEKRLRNWINSSELIKPSYFHTYLNQMLDKGLTDLSVSRPRSRLTWGIPVPDDESQTIYVWLDALVNYLTVTNYPDKHTSWPPDCQVIGKDIFNFHTIFWPAFLLAADFELPKKIICHSHWQVNGQKMSKSIGNVISPFDLVKPFTLEGVRYFFLRNGYPSSDANFSNDAIKNIVNSDLADTMGNLLLRAVSPVINKRNVFPRKSFNDLPHNLLAEQIATVLANISNKVDFLLDQGEFGQAIEHILSPVRLANKLFEETKPWILVKSDPENNDLLAAIYIALESIRIAAILLQPIVPEYSTRILNKLNVPEEKRTWEDARIMSESEWKDDIPLLRDKLVPFEKIR